MLKFTFVNNQPFNFTNQPIISIKNNMSKNNILSQISSKRKTPLVVPSKQPSADLFKILTTSNYVSKEERQKTNTQSLAPPTTTKQNVVSNNPTPLKEKRKNSQEDQPILVVDADIEEILISDQEKINQLLEEDNKKSRISSSKESYTSTQKKQQPHNFDNTTLNIPANQKQFKNEILCKSDSIYSPYIPSAQHAHSPNSAKEDKPSSDQVILEQLFATEERREGEDDDVSEDNSLVTNRKDVSTKRYHTDSNNKKEKTGLTKMIFDSNKNNQPVLLDFSLNSVREESWRSLSKNGVTIILPKMECDYCANSFYDSEFFHTEHGIKFGKINNCWGFLIFAGMFCSQMCFNTCLLNSLTNFLDTNSSFFKSETRSLISGTCLQRFCHEKPLLYYKIILDGKIRGFININGVCSFKAVKPVILDFLTKSLYPIDEDIIIDNSMHISSLSR